MKKILSVFLACLMMLSIIVVPVSAMSIIDEPWIAVSLDKWYVCEGELVTASVILSKNTYLGGLTCDLTYDNTVLRVVPNSMKTYGVFKDTYGKASEHTNERYTDSSVRFVGVDSDVIKNEEAVIFTVQFRAIGEGYSWLDFNIEEAWKEVDGEFVDVELNPIQDVITVGDYPAIDTTVYIQQPSQTTIRYKDGIVLHVDTLGELPENCTMLWGIEGGTFDMEWYEPGESLLITSTDNGESLITVYIKDGNGDIIATDTIIMNSKAGFFDKIGGFFRSIFGLTKIYDITI